MSEVRARGLHSQAREDAARAKPGGHSQVLGPRVTGSPLAQSEPSKGNEHTDEHRLVVRFYDEKDIDKERTDVRGTIWCGDTT
jgi:hypothetical protein